MNIKKIAVTSFFLFLIFLILTQSSLSLHYAVYGLAVWYSKMIPSLLPFMILTGIMIRMGMTESFSNILYPILHPIFRVSKNVCFCIIIGFLCGFPMGARTTSDLLKRNLITEKEATFLLSFCNNIGPVYFCGFVLPLLDRKLFLPYVIGMYGIPLMYGIVLRYTIYHSIFPQKEFLNKIKQTSSKHTSLSILTHIDDAIYSAVENILMLGGYMILFNLLNIIPHYFLNKLFFLQQYINVQIFEKVIGFVSPLIEITVGLNRLGSLYPVYALCILPIGGLCCIAQTYSMIKKTNLSLRTYVVHKCVQTALTVLFYLGWWIIYPTSFLY